MDKADFIAWRKGIYMAQILEAFERDLEPHLAVHGPLVRDFKGLVRARLNALATDSSMVVALEDGAINILAQQIRDRMSPVGRP